MGKIGGAVLSGMLSMMLILAVNGCQTQTSQEGIHVMFDGVPRIYDDKVYQHGQVVGNIQKIEGQEGPVAMINVRIDSPFNQHCGNHWVFYVNHGRLTVGKLKSSGQPVKAGDRVCGFLSKAQFSWFKVKTLLSHRISKANRRADKLFQRHAQAG